MDALTLSLMKRLLHGPIMDLKTGAAQIEDSRWRRVSWADRYPPQEVLRLLENAQTEGLAIDGQWNLNLAIQDLGQTPGDDAVIWGKEIGLGRGV